MAALRVHLSSHRICFMGLPGDLESELARTLKIGSALIHCFAQRFAGLEVGHVLLWNRHTFATAWIAPEARRPVVDRETAKAPNFDSVPVHPVSYTHLRA